MEIQFLFLLLCTKKKISSAGWVVLVSHMVRLLEMFHCYVIQPTVVTIIVYYLSTNISLPLIQNDIPCLLRNTPSFLTLLSRAWTLSGHLVLQPYLKQKCINSKL
jgi:hypothetical protein